MCKGHPKITLLNKLLNPMSALLRRNAFQQVLGIHFTKNILFHYIKTYEINIKPS